MGMLSAFLHLKTLFRRNRVVAALNGRRRFMGLAAFSYALPYLSFYFSYEGWGPEKQSFVTIFAEPFEWNS
jgi:hypothetical protein